MQDRQLVGLIRQLIKELIAQDTREYYKIENGTLEITEEGKQDIELNYYLKTLADVINVKDKELKETLRQLMDKTGDDYIQVQTGNYIMEIYGAKDTITTHADTEKMKRDGIYEQYIWQDKRKGHIRIVQQYDLKGYEGI